MTGWTPDVAQATIIIIGVIQGAGLGFLFVPLSTVTLSTLSPEQRTEGAGLYSLSRNIGSSVGISVVDEPADDRTRRPTTPTSLSTSPPSTECSRARPSPSSGIR